MLNLLKNIFIQKKFTPNQLYFIIGYSKIFDIFNKIDIKDITSDIKINNKEELIHKYKIIGTGMFFSFFLIISSVFILTIFVFLSNSIIKHIVFIFFYIFILFSVFYFQHILLNKSFKITK